MWDMAHYVSLLLGEVPRPADTPEAYGPRGKDFLVHVDVPDQVHEAVALVSDNLGVAVREADVRFGSTP